MARAADSTTHSVRFQKQCSGMLRHFIPCFPFCRTRPREILSLISPLAETESVAIQECYQRVLAREVFSPNNVPAYRNSAMDGYALRSDDLERDSYRVVAEVLRR